MADQPDLEARVAEAETLERERSRERLVVEAHLARAVPVWVDLALDLIADWRSRGDALAAQDAALAGIVERADGLLADTGCGAYYLGKKVAARELRARARLPLSPAAGSELAELREKAGDRNACAEACEALHDDILTAWNETVGRERDGFCVDDAVPQIIALVAELREEVQERRRQVGRLQQEHDEIGVALNAFYKSSTHEEFLDFCRKLREEVKRLRAREAQFESRLAAARVTTEGPVAAGLHMQLRTAQARLKAVGPLMKAVRNAAQFIARQAQEIKQPLSDAWMDQATMLRTALASLDAEKGDAAVVTVPRAALAVALGLAEIGFEATYDAGDTRGAESRRSLDVCVRPFRDAPKGERGAGGGPLSRDAE